jgi:hypothetical protein
MHWKRAKYSSMVSLVALKAWKIRKKNNIASKNHCLTDTSVRDGASSAKFSHVKKQPPKIKENSRYSRTMRIKTRTLQPEFCDVIHSKNFINK